MKKNEVKKIEFWTLIQFGLSLWNNPRYLKKKICGVALVY